MAFSATAQVRGSHVGSRVSMILQEMQKRQADEMATALERRKSEGTKFARKVVVAVMGVTGAGKSSFIRRVTGNDDVQVGHSLQSSKIQSDSPGHRSCDSNWRIATQRVQPFKFEHENTNFSIVDTPGFNDTQRSDNDVLEELADWLRDEVKVSGIIYLHRISSPRMEGSALRNLRMFRKLCGDEFMKNVVLGTTFWDIVSEEIGSAREEELLQTDNFFKNMKALGCDVVRISDDRDSNLKLLSRFAVNRPSVMQIQQELIEGKSLAETAAAYAISQELAELQRQGHEQLADAEHQSRRIMTRSELELAYTLQLGKRSFEETMEAMNTEQDEIRKEIEEQQKAEDEKLKELTRQKSRESQKFQMQLSELNEQMQALRASLA
jgi:septin family protein